MPLSTRLMHTFIFTVLASAQILILFFAYLQFVPMEIAHIDRFEPETTEASPSSQLVFNLTYHKLIESGATIRRSIVCDDGTVLMLSTEQANMPVGEYEYKRLINLPDSLPIGHTCYMSLDASYQVTPFRIINEHFKSKEFKVIK